LNTKSVTDKVAVKEKHFHLLLYAICLHAQYKSIIIIAFNCFKRTIEHQNSTTCKVINYRVIGHKISATTIL